MFSWFRKKKDRRQAVIEPIYHWSDDEIPRYPPFMKGLPVVSPEKLLETQSELIERIRNTAITTPEDFSRYFAPAIERFAGYAHLLPASQSHHHRGAGGLLRHSLEVGLWALQSADKVLLDAAKTPSQRREMEPRWQFAVFVAALCHDAGKPVTDVTVANRDRSAVWKPIKEDLYEWASKNKIDAYFLDWREGRGRQHTALSNLIADRIIGSEALEWIEEGGTELVVWLLESLNCNPGPTNMIHDLVIKADQTSVERDLKTLGVAMAGYDLGVPVERHLTDIMRRFIREGVWLVNEPGARVWNIGGHIYLIWPAAGEEIVKQVKEDGIPGIPRTPDGILDMLVERQIAHIREDAPPGDRLWKIAPACLAEKIPDIKLTAIRLRDEAMISSSPIPSVEGRIVVSIHAQTVQAKQHGRGDASPAFDYPPEGGGSQPELVFDEKPDPVKTGEKEKENETGQAARQPSPPVQEAEKPKPIEPSPSPPVKEKRSASVVTRESETKHRSEKDATPSVQLSGAIGEALRALAQDLVSGDKKMGVDAIVEGKGNLLLRWPDAFSGYGLTTKTILEELSGKGWLWIDPLAPLKKVQDAQFGAETVKAIRLQPEISAAILDLVGNARASNLPQQPSIATEDRQEPEIPIQGQRSTKPATKASRGSASKQKTPQDQKVAEKKSAQSAPPPQIIDDAPEPEKSGKSARRKASLDEVLQALASVPAPSDANGWRTILKRDAISACRKQGIALTYGEVEALADQDGEGRIILDGQSLRFKPA